MEEEEEVKKDMRARKIEEMDEEMEDRRGWVRPGLECEEWSGMFQECFRMNEGTARTNQLAHNRTGAVMARYVYAHGMRAKGAAATQGRTGMQVPEQPLAAMWRGPR